LSRKPISLYYPLLIYLSLISPLSLFSIIPALFFLYNRILKRYAWLYYTLGTFSLLLAFFFFQMTTEHELVAIITASVTALVLRESDKVPFWMLLVIWLALLGWFSGPLAVFCVLLVVWMEWEWYKKLGITIVLLVLLFFPIPIKTSIWWLPKYNITRETPQQFGFHNYEGKYHKTASEEDVGAGTQSEQVAFAHPMTWMDSIIDWTVFILMILIVLILVRMLFMLRQVRHRLGPHFIRSFLVTAVSTVLIGGMALFYRLVFMNVKDLPPDSPVTAILQQFKAPAIPSTVSPQNTNPIITSIRQIPPAIQYAVLSLIALCMLIGIFLLTKLLLQLFQITFVPDKEIDSETIQQKTESPTPLVWDAIKNLPIPEIIDRVYAGIRASQPQINHLTPYEYLTRFPSDALRTWTDWIIRLHYAPGSQHVFPSLKQLQDLFSQLIIP